MPVREAVALHACAPSQANTRPDRATLTWQLMGLYNVLRKRGLKDGDVVELRLTIVDSRRPEPADEEAGALIPR